MSNRGKDSGPLSVRRDSRPNDPRPREKEVKNKPEARSTIPVDLFRSLPRHPNSEASRPKVNQGPPEIYGTISTIKQGFGFLQPVVEEEQIYFGGREMSADMKVGDRVGFVTRESARGLAAENVRLLSGQTDKVVAVAKGTVSRNPDRHRSNFGMVTIEAASLDARSASLLEASAVKDVLFHPADVVARSVPKNHRLDKGDFVEFAVHRVVGSNMFVAKAVTMLQLKRERAMALQIQRMLDAGVPREQGVVSALKKGEYGFIKPLDRKEDIYFRAEDGKGKDGADGDGADGDGTEKLAEGDEVEFFVITECVKGKMSDRAIHVRAIPKGTVKFEVQLASAVSAVVIAESGARAEECPGIARLYAPVVLGSTLDPVLAAAAASASAKNGGAQPASGEAPETSISTIELWQRCLPDELVCRVGDVLTLDVHYYRPEKLFFARSVKVARFRSLGRERGTVCALKENGFGFIHSTVRNSDAYFKSSHVLSADTSLPIAESALRVGSVVSFDVVCEDTNGGGKLRAKRVVLESPTLATQGARDSEFLIKSDLTGVVVRNSTKKDSPGLIRIAGALAEELAQIEFFDPEVVASLGEFRDCAELTSVVLYGLPLSALRTYSSIIDAKFPGIAHESSPVNTHEPALGHNLKIFKLVGDKYDQWRASKKSTHASAADASGTTLSFYKDDYVSPEFGPLANDLKVVFSLYWDPSRGRRLAKGIRLTDEPVVDPASGAELGEQRGVVDVMVDKGEKYGFIRCVPSDEKLFWHVASSAQPSGGATFMLGSEVGFSLRRRGGLRCAANIHALAPGTLMAEETLSGSCQALIVSVVPPLLVLLDVNAVAELRRKFIDLRVLSEATGSKKEDGAAGALEAWSKLSLSPVGELAKDVDAVCQDAPTASPTDEPDQTASRLVGESAAAEGESEYRAKYFPALPRTPVPFTCLVDLALKEGDVVRCAVNVKWGVQRSPVSATVNERCEDAMVVGALKKGRLQRAKFRARALATSAFVDSETLSCYNIAATDLVEVMDPSGNGEAYFCTTAELAPAEEHSRELPQQGDEVVFWAVAGLGVNAALAAKLSPRAKEFGGIQFGKRPIAPGAVADAGKPKIVPLSLITMAEGPPNDAASGFPSGWRSAAPSGEGLSAGAGTVVGAGLMPPVVVELPWAHLLTHLQ